MPSKRKTEAAAEPSPPTKTRRSTKEKVEKKEKKRPRESDEQDAVTRVRRSKKKISEDDESVAPVPAVVSTPRKRVTKAKSPVGSAQASPVAAAPKSSLKSAAKARTRKSIVRIDLPAEPASAERPRSAPVTPTLPSPVTSPALASARLSSSLKKAAINVMTELPKDQPSDDLEIVSVWNQVWGSLMMCLKTLGPAFLVIILSCYFLGTLQQSQAIATVGVVYTILFLTIMGSYTVVILPCILIARVFTSIVSPHATAHSADEVNLYSRLLVLILAAVGLGYYFFQTAFVN